ncbi:alpha/beta hydrolase [Paenibacillus sp. MER TA 81-3]|uniref:alpha/beta fold hydrolase n=1 Tax=Paenibacillus sp. MER TA 81-3 TaxID=2939573 RepID=UPI00203D8FE6|nr:alpha/beta hydrolase [Paenibacillus sp. MER TA 81-3]MCM3337682.1 alpha/beta hydrolase [Paenibacillus sp. MER TA 81-3]
MKGYIHLPNQKKVYYEVVGEEHFPTYVYIHGGPGTGSYDFLHLQGKALSEFLRIIAVDQRGVLRSDPLEEDEACGLQDIIADFETIREYFQLQSWGVISHSFGGYIGTKYCLQLPHVVTSLIYECPTFDLHSSSVSILKGAADMYKRLGQIDDAAACMKAAAIRDAQTIWEELSCYLHRLGDKRDELYVHGEDKHFFDKMVAELGISAHHWSRSGTHQKKLYEEGSVFASLIDDLTHITCPALLLQGRYDLVTSPEQAEAFSKGACRRTELFHNSGHFPRFEEPERYVEVIRDFVSGLR